MIHFFSVAFIVFGPSAVKLNVSVMVVGGGIVISSTKVMMAFDRSQFTARVLMAASRNIILPILHVTFQSESLLLFKCK